MKQNQRLLSKHNRKNGLTLLHGQKRMKTIAPQSAASPVTTKDLEKHAILPATHQSYKNRHPDGTDGSHAYHSGNVVPGGLENPQVKGRRFDEQTYWHNNPYWKYFKQIWGNAPMIDSNFRLWLSGFFKSYSVPHESQAYQETKGLPAFYHYFGKTYDPLVDPPYASDYELYGKDAKSGVKAHTPNGNTIQSDCTSSNFLRASGFKRPCNVNSKEAMGWTAEKSENNLMKTLGRSAMMEGKKMNAGDPRGSIYFTYNKLPETIGGEGEAPWIGLDSTWGKNTPGTRPENLPEPPKDTQPPAKIQFGFDKPEKNEKKNVKGGDGEPSAAAASGDESGGSG
jgi:hypothetical protein